MAITGVKSRFVVTAGGVIMLVLGLLPMFGRVVAAVALNILFNEIKIGNPPAGQGSVFTEAPPRFVPIASIEHLQNHLGEGDTVKDGKLGDSEGNEIRCIIASGEVVPAPLDSKKSGTAGEH